MAAIQFLEQHLILYPFSNTAGIIYVKNYAPDSIFASFELKCCNSKIVDIYCIEKTLLANIVND